MFNLTADSPPIYFGPRTADIGEVAIAAGVGSAQTPPLTGYLDQVIFDNGGSSDTFNISITRANGGEVVYAATGKTTGGVARPAAVEHKSEDGTALTSRRRIFLFDERLTVAYSSATNGVVMTCSFLTLPN